MNEKTFALALLLVLSISFAYTYTLKLQKGWNLIGLPFPSGTLPSDSECIVPKIWGYYDGNYVESDLRTSVMGFNYAGFFVYAKDKCTVVASESQSENYYGVPLSTENLDYIWERGGGALNFAKGWNFVAGFTDSPDVNDVKGGCTITNGPYYYDTFSNSWVQSDTLSEGKGYVIKVEDSCKFGFDVVAPIPPLPEMPE